MIDQDKIRTLLDTFEADCLGIIYNGLVHQQPKAKILSLIRKEIMFLDNKTDLRPDLRNYLWFEALGIYNKCSKKAYSRLMTSKKALGSINYQNFLKQRSEAVFEVLESIAVQDRILRKAGTYVINSLHIDEARSEFRSLVSDPKYVFYICDVHDKCATDHLKFQGRIYIDEDWESKVEDKELRQKIKSYIINKHILAVQKVVFGSPWLITRPNCRHRLHPVRTEEVLTGSARSILNKKNLIRVGRDPISNEESVYRSYQLRLELHKKLYKIMPNEELAKRIADDRRLVKKWYKASR